MIIKFRETIENYFANFIKNGHPNGSNLPKWPAVEKNATDPEAMIIGTESKAEKATNDNRYMFLGEAYGNK